METKLPGLKASHQIITPECRTNRGVDGALDEAFDRIRATYGNCAEIEANANVNWHLVLVREGPAA